MTIEDAGPKGPPRQTVAPLHAVDALVLELPPAPDFSKWTLDTTWAPPEPPAAAPQSPSRTKAIDELQEWLAAIVQDRAQRR